MKLYKLGALAAMLMIGSAALAQTSDTKPGAAKSGDVVVNVNVPILQSTTNALPINQVGQTAYTTQESTLGKTQSSAGIQYYYIWVGVNGQYVPVDPMRFTETR